MRFIPLLVLTTLLATVALAAEPPNASLTAAFIPPKDDDEFVEAMRRALHEPYPNKHERDVLALLDFLTPKNAERVGQLFTERNKDGVRSDFAWNAYWRRRGEVDGEATLNALNTGHDPAPGYWHHEATMEGWAASDPAAAERWLRAHATVKYYWVYYQRLVAAWARTDPDRATQVLFDFGKDDKFIYDALAVLTDTLQFMGGPARIATWFDTLNDAGKQAAMNHAAWRIKDGDLAAAAKWFAAQADKPWRDDKHLGVFLDRYMDTDPKAALEWITALPLPAGDPNPAGLQASLKRWAKRDRAAALRWLDEHQDRPWWPCAASGCVQALSEKGAGGAESFLAGLKPAVRAAVEGELKR